jgi:hypothetical protein
MDPVIDLVWRIAYGLSGVGLLTALAGIALIGFGFVGYFKKHPETSDRVFLWCRTFYIRICRPLIGIPITPKDGSSYLILRRPIRNHVFFEQTVLQREVRDDLLQGTGLPAQILDLAARAVCPILQRLANLSCLS